MALTSGSEMTRDSTLETAPVVGALLAPDLSGRDSEKILAGVSFDAYSTLTPDRRAEHPEETDALTTPSAQQRSDDFLALFSHETRSALGAIRNAANLLRMQRGENSVALRAGALIERQVDRLTRLFDDVTDITRAHSNELSLKCERIDLCVVVRNALDTLAVDLSARRHRVALSLPSEPLWLQGDAGRIEQVLVNLLSNAAKYTDPGGKLGISLHQTAEQATLSVRDSGIGIAPDLLPRVFDLYMQADPASHRGESGLGIGLALVRSLVELHGGRVTATSAGIGQGSVFFVYLPITAG
jgi:signal transduction histidine kinase